MKLIRENSCKLRRGEHKSTTGNNLGFDDADAYMDEKMRRR